MTLLPACTGSGVTTPSSTTTAAPTAPIVVDSLTQLDAGPGPVYSVVMWEHYVVWVGAPAARTLPDRVMLHDLDTKTTRTLATSHYPHGIIERVRANQDSVVYVDLARPTSDDSPRTPWRMYEVSVTTGRERLLQTSTSPLEEEEPARPSVVWPWVAWFVPTGSGEHVSVRSLDLRSGEQRTLVESATARQLAMDDVTLTVVYDDENGRGGQDIYGVPVDGSAPPKRLTDSGQADFPIARHGGLVWQHPPDADAESLWYKALPDGKPHQFSARTEIFHAGNNAFPGEGFVAWYGKDGLMVRDSKARLPAVQIEPEENINGAARFWVDGDRVTWATDQDIGSLEERSTIHVAEVRVDGTQGP